MRAVFLIAFFGLFLLVVLVMLGAAGRSWWKSNQVEAWPVVDGEVIERDFSVDSDSEGTSYRAVVRYRYTVAGRSYESDRQTLALLKILALGQKQIEQEKFSDIDDVFAELDELDRQEKQR